MLVTLFVAFINKDVFVINLFTVKIWSNFSSIIYNPCCGFWIYQHFFWLLCPSLWCCLVDNMNKPFSCGRYKKKWALETNSIFKKINEELLSKFDLKSYDIYLRDWEIHHSLKSLGFLDTNNLEYKSAIKFIKKKSFPKLSILIGSRGKKLSTREGNYPLDGSWEPILKKKIINSSLFQQKFKWTGFQHKGDYIFKRKKILLHFHGWCQRSVEDFVDVENYWIKHW